MCLFWEGSLRLLGMPHDPPGAVLSGAGSGCCHQHHGALPLAPLCTPRPLFPGRFLPLAGRSDAESRAADPLTQVRRTAGRLPSCTVVALGVVPWRCRSASAALLT